MTRAEDRGGQDGFALVLSLLLIVVVAGLSLTMAAVILNQQQPTQESRKRVQTVNAAQSGLQVGLTAMRAANDGANNGVLTKVPCTSSTGAKFATTSNAIPVAAPGATFTGMVSAVVGTGSPAYKVSVAYFRINPAGQSPDWLKANAMPCPLQLVPKYAYLQSFGSGAQVPGDAANQSNRTQIATYDFSTSNANIVGGRLRSYGTQLCLDAGSNPVPGTQLFMQPCLALGTAQQTWQYRQDLTIFYGGNTTLNLCVQPPTSGNQVVLRTCTGSGSGSTYGYASGQQAQEWPFNDNGHFAAAADNGDVSGNCLQPAGSGGANYPANAPLQLVGCSGGTSDSSAFDPDPQVGAGKAGGGITGVPGATKQYVNYAQFGRCLDITGQNVNADHLIAYPCKQAPDSTKLTFNQVWTYTGTSTTYGTFYVNAGVPYCLTAPTSGTYITTTPCNSLLYGDAQQWKATGEVTSNYALSYTLVNKASGACMAVSPLSQAITFASSNIIVAACDGSASQKWNAPPMDPTSRITNIQETSGN